MATRSPLATAAAMAGGSIPGWFGLYPQSPADPYTTDFKSSGLPAGWSTWNPGALTTVSCTEEERLKVSQAAHAGAGLGGAIRTAPAYSAFCMTACLNVRGKPDNYGASGIVVGGSDLLGAPTTARLLVHHNTLQDTGWQVDTNTYQRYNLFDSAHASLDPARFRFLRVFFTTDSLGSFTFLGSDDGNEWILLSGINQAAANLEGTGAVPGYMGVFVNNEVGSGEDLAVTCPLFRVDETDDPFLPCGVYLG